MGRHRAGPPEAPSSKFDVEPPGSTPVPVPFDPGTSDAPGSVRTHPLHVGLGPDPVPPAPARTPEFRGRDEPIGLSVRMLLMTLVAGLLAAVALSVASLLPR